VQTLVRIRACVGASEVAEYAHVLVRHSAGVCVRTYIHVPAPSLAPRINNFHAIDDPVCVCVCVCRLLKDLTEGPYKTKHAEAD
jgi:hypothetical protein